jgi:AcrR family transcriptional regulator
VTDLHPSPKPGGALVPSPAEDAPGATPPDAPAEPFPWEGEPPPEEEFGPDGRRVRHDAFTARRKHEFLKALAKGGCVEDSCRAVGIAPATLYRHQQEDKDFLRLCLTAARMCAVPVEITAWERAVDGVDQPFACGGEVHVRRRYSDGLLRLLLQGSNPKKYGARPGFTRKRLLKFERKRMEKEIKAELRAAQREHERTPEQITETIIARIEAIKRHDEPAKLAAGWTKSPEGHWILPGYAPIEGRSPPTSESPDGETPRDSV